MTLQNCILPVALSMVLYSGCNRQEVPKSPKTDLRPVHTIDESTAATVMGVVRLTGPVPKPIMIDMSADPGCKGHNLAEPIAAKNGNLANVFVYVKDGLADGTWQQFTTQVEILQQGCKYVPHVLGIMAGQAVRIVNADTAMHNIHPMPRNNREWNVSQMPQGEPIVRRFDNPELMVPVKCNQHPWMKMYVNVSGNPFFAVTGDNGKFELRGLPPGTYTIAAIHEVLGEQTQRVTVGARDNIAVQPFQFVSQNGAAEAK